MPGMRHHIAGLFLVLSLVPFIAGAQPGPPDTGPAAPPGETGDAPVPESTEVAFERLEIQLRSEDSGARSMAALVLGQLGDPRGAPLLIKVLQQDAAPEVREAAVQALALIKSDISRQALADAANNDADPGVREAAAAALAPPKLSEPPPVPREDVTSPPPIPEEDRRPTATSSNPAYNPENHPDYASARRMRTAGVLVTVIGGGVGLIAGAIGGLATGICNSFSDNSWDGSSDCSTPTGIAVAGGLTFAVSLAVGIPLIASGQRKLNAIQLGPTALVPQVQVVLNDKTRLISAGWRF